MGQRPATITQPQVSAPPPVDTPPLPFLAPGSASTPSAGVGGATAIIRVTDLMKSAPQIEIRDLPKGEMPRLLGLTGNVRGKEQTELLGLLNRNPQWLGRLAAEVKALRSTDKD